MAELQVTGICRLTRDPDVRETSMGTWLDFDIVSYRKIIKEGKQDSDFFTASLFTKNLEIVKAFKKGTLILLENATLKNDEYEKDGVKKHFIKISIFSCSILNENTFSQKMEISPAAPVKKENPDIKISTHPSDLGVPSRKTQYAPKMEKTNPEPEISNDDLPPWG
jgi:single-stranded DNA-binding protein